MKKENVNNLTLSAMFLAMGIILPMLFGQIQQIGQMLLPMHIPVFLCAFICGWKFSVPMAAILPILRSLLFSKPNFYPQAIAIAFEMATYAFVAAIIYKRIKSKGIFSVYLSLISAMILGRIMRAIAELSLLGIAGNGITIGAFISAAIIPSIPGIILQLILIPLIMEVIKIAERNKN